jgi:tRNA A-37 threonylcarbamoyl transferase component Bud32
MDPVNHLLTVRRCVWIDSGLSTATASMKREGGDIIVLSPAVG